MIFYFLLISFVLVLCALEREFGILEFIADEIYEEMYLLVEEGPDFTPVVMHDIFGPQVHVDVVRSGNGRVEVDS